MFKVIIYRRNEENVMKQSQIFKRNINKAYAVILADAMTNEKSKTYCFVKNSKDKIVYCTEVAK